MCMTEYLPDPASEHDSTQRKQSVASSRPSNSTGRPSRSGSTADSASGSHSHGAARSRRQSAYPNHNRPPPTTGAHHGRRRQHSIAYAPRRSTFSDDRLVESSCPSSRHSSRQCSRQYEIPDNVLDLVQVLGTARIPDVLPDVVLARVPDTSRRRRRRRRRPALDIRARSRSPIRSPCCRSVTTSRRGRRTGLTVVQGEVQQEACCLHRLTAVGCCRRSTNSVNRRRRRCHIRVRVVATAAPPQR